MATGKVKTLYSDKEIYDAFIKGIITSDQMNEILNK